MNFIEFLMHLLLWNEEYAEHNIDGSDSLH